MTVQSLFNLQDEVAVVTGGAQGLGEQMAIGLAEAGAHVVVADINLDNAEKVAQTLKTIGVEAIAIQVDVTQKPLVENMVNTVINHFKKIDILVTSAGVGQWVPAEEMPESEWKRIMDINLNGTFYCCQAVGRKIVNTPQCQSHYNTSKGGVIMLTKSLASEWAPHGVRVNSIAPGYMKTQLVADLLLQYPQYAEAWTKLVPFGRFGQPEEIKGPCVFLASKASSFVTGSVVVMDGGYTIW